MKPEDRPTDYGDMLTEIVALREENAKMREAVIEECQGAITLEIDKLSDEMNKSFAREQDERGELYRGMLQGAHVALQAIERLSASPERQDEERSDTASPGGTEAE